MTRFLGIAAFLVAIGFLTAQPADDGVEVQTRGPIHEAFAQPADQHPSPAPLVAKKPPDPIEEIPPDQKPEGDDVIWIPGYFAFDADRDDFLWISGIWRSEPPDRQWIPGYWQHEEGGYRWVGGYWALETQTSIELLPPPPQPVEEVPPPQTDVNTVYVPGVWVYRTDRYLWQPGHWITARPGWIWTPPNYCWSPRGYIFVPGYWDFELHRRGLCFAPVWFDHRVYARPGWAYRPRYVLGVDFLLTSLFVNVNHNHYYFGDYYDAGYGRRGYTPWVNHRVRGNVHDPMFYHYRWAHRQDDRWEANMRQTFQTRQQNQAARPPRTLAQQQKVADAKFQIAAPLEQVKIKGVKLQTVQKTQLEEIRKNAQQLRTLSQERRKVEVETKAKSPVTKDAPKAPIKIDLPKTNIKRPANRQKPPPPPDGPKVQEKDIPKVKPKPDVPKKVTPDPLPKPDVPKVKPKDEPKKVVPDPLPKPDVPKVKPKDEPKKVPPDPLPKPDLPKPKPPTKDPDPPKKDKDPPKKDKDDKDKDKDKKSKDKKDGALRILEVHDSMAQVHYARDWTRAPEDVPLFDPRECITGAT